MDILPNAEFFGEKGQFGIGRHLNAEFAHPNHGTKALTFLATSLWLALVRAVRGIIEGGPGRCK